MSFDKELLEKVVIAVIAAFSKEVIAWLWRRSSSLGKWLRATLKPAVSHFLGTYWRLIVDQIGMFGFFVMIRPGAPLEMPITRGDIFMIALPTCGFFYFMLEWSKDWEAIQKKKQPNTDQLLRRSAQRDPG